MLSIYALQIFFVGMAAFSYDTQEEDPYDDDYLLCFGLFSITTAAKFFSCYFFVICLLVSGLNFLAFGFDHTWYFFYISSMMVFQRRRRLKARQFH
ncbi:hypothetical protein OSTOST_00871, partial [Ostertagia ostertagi]